MDASQPFTEVRTDVINIHRVLADQFRLQNLVYDIMKPRPPIRLAQTPYALIRIYADQIPVADAVVVIQPYQPDVGNFGLCHVYVPAISGAFGLVLSPSGREAVGRNGISS